MAITCVCPGCGRQYSKIKNELAGKKVRCACGLKITLPEPPQPDSPRHSQSTKPFPVSTSAANPEAPPRQLVDLDYSDLETILSRADAAEEVLVPSNPMRNRIVEKPAGSIPPSIDQYSSPARTIQQNQSRGKDHPLQSNPGRAGLWFLLTITTALLAFWIGGILILPRLTDSIQNPLLNWLGQPLGQIYTGNFGTAEISPILKNGFFVSGWLLLLLAGMLVLLAGTLCLNAMLQLFTRKQFFKQADGLLATVSVLLLFLFIANLFLHKSHTSNLHREIKSLTANVVSEEIPPQFIRLRQDYDLQEQTFQFRTLTIAVLPFFLFVIAMLRLILRDRWN